MAAYRYSTSADDPPPRFRTGPRLAFGLSSEPGQNSIVPSTSIAGNALMSVVAIMSFLACLTVGAVTLIGDAARDWQADVGREVTIQVRPVDGADVAAETKKAADIARTTPGIASAEALDDAQNADLLRPWLGEGLDAADLPIPHLIVVGVSDPSAADFAALAQRLASEVKGASLDDHRMWIERLRTMAGVTVGIGFAILALVFAATVLSVVFATRGAMAGNRHIVSVLHFVGAEDTFIASEFQRHFLLLGFKGGLIGAASAAVVFLIVGVFLSPATTTAEGAQVAALFGRFSVGISGYLGAIGIAFAIALLTAVTSRLTVFRYLATVE